jgi:cytochrome c
MVRVLDVAWCCALVLLAVQLTNISSAHAAGDPEKGAKMFRRCATCHSANVGGTNKVGPNLFGIVGRKVASLSDYMYSMAMESADFVWSEDKLTVFLQHPQQFLLGTKMPFNGLNGDDASDIVAYLKSLK